MTEALSQFKYVIFFATLLFGVPVGYVLGRKYKKFEYFLFFMLVFFTARMEDINFVSREKFRITTKGFEVGLVDIVTLILFFIILDRKKIFKIERIPKGLSLYLLYFSISLISIVNADNYLFSAFEAVKMFRMILFYWVVYNYIQKEEQLHRLMRIISIIIIYIFLAVVKQKYVDHMFQTMGPFPHQNSLVMYMLVFNSIVLSYLLNYKKITLWYWGMIFGMGSVVIVSTLSRAGMASFAVSCGIIFMVSFITKFTGRKLFMLLGAMLIGMLVLAKAMDTIIERFETAPEESANVRIMLAQAAVNMANDKVLGIGLNNFGVKINSPYWYGQHIPDGGNPDVQNGLVETVYLMVAAETGWIGLFIFLLFIWTFYYWNIRNIKKMKYTTIQFMAIGLTGGLLGIYLESTLEWVLKQTNNFYQLMFVFAIIAAMVKIDKRYKKQMRRIRYGARNQR